MNHDGFTLFEVSLDGQVGTEPNFRCPLMFLITPTDEKKEEMDKQSEAASQSLRSDGKNLCPPHRLFALVTMQAEP